MNKQDIEEFVSYVKDNLTGDEKGQAQTFCDRLFRAFGQKGIYEASGQMEVRVKEADSKSCNVYWLYSRRIVSYCQKGSLPKLFKTAWMGNVMHMTRLVACSARWQAPHLHGQEDLRMCVTLTGACSAR